MKIRNIEIQIRDAYPEHDAIERHDQIEAKQEFCMDELLVRIHSIIERILADRPCAMGV